MTKIEILKKLIEYYEKTIKNLPEGDIDGYLENRCVQRGICLCASSIFDTSIYHGTWVVDNCKSVYWFKIPIYAYGREEKIECLQFRIDKMKEILNEEENS